MEKKDYGREMLDFIGKSPSCFHVTKHLGEKFRAAGFAAISEAEDWRLQAGGKYYVTRNDSSLIAFQVPADIETRSIGGFHIAASHSDSPCFKVKEKAEMETEKRYICLNTEKYGGMILSTWMDRPLSVAGRIVVREDEAERNTVPEKNGKAAGERAGEGQRSSKGGLRSRLVNVDRDLLVIPNLAIHMNRDMNKGVEYNPQSDMLPLFAECSTQKEAGCAEQGNAALLQTVAEAAGVAAADILGHDLFLYVRDKGRVFGAQGEFVLSPKLDDLQCVYASAEAFAGTTPKEYISVCAVFDNEEVGSGTRQGADSTFLEDTLARITSGLGANREKYLEWIAGSFLISADNAHAVHPNHPEKADPTNRPCLNGGIVIKYHGSQKYTTDGMSAARMKDLCERAGVPWQTYANRSDIAGGSTLGNILAAHVSLASVDIGLPQLAMHSAVETGGMRDTEYAVKMFQVFFAE